MAILVRVELARVFANILKTIKYSCEWEFGKVWYKPKCKFVKFDLSKFGTNFLSGTETKL